jgi:hypothetical protein
MTFDYTILYKDSFESVAGLASGQQWDVFISAFNMTERVQTVYDAIDSREKYWIVHREYGFTATEIPINGRVYSAPDLTREDDFMIDFLGGLPDLQGVTLCVDISGFMRPHLMFLLLLLSKRGITAFDVLYSEPAQYALRELTEFARGDVTDVRPVAGFEGNHQPSLSHDEDVLIIGVGYEHDLIRHVANSKNNARKLQLVGFPPLQADFYQENRLNAHRAAEAVSAVNENNPIFAPANDPFVTAKVLQEEVENQRRRGAKNVYLCPISSRPQALGFALYYLFEGQNQAVSLLYPFASRYAPGAAAGISRVWRYRIEFP